jgi:antitoxin VapB
MNVVKVFANGRSQAVRLPKECRFAEKRLVVKRVGDMVMIFPPRKAWKIFAEGLKGFSEDFMADRRQPRRTERRQRL